MKASIFFLVFWVVPVFAETSTTVPAPESMQMTLATQPNQCSDMETWNFSSGMCDPLPMPGMSMIMLHGNAFLTQVEQSSARGRDSVAIPNMFMLDAGKSIGDRQYLNVELMGTFEKWTYPGQGYPELLQIGESNQQGLPFIDAQHPHSSPIMGLTFSDTFALGAGKDTAKFFFAPRGESTDGPVAFMHRQTAEVNPDAPLGHHVGQDVGHITSTVLGTSVHLGASTFEASAFNGQEPNPTAVDLPLGGLDSGSLRWIQAWNDKFYSMASLAYVRNPEDDSSIDHVYRSSASLYFNQDLAAGWKFSDSFIYGLIDNYDHTASLSSVTEEFLFHQQTQDFWGRWEVLQRTPEELAISLSTSAEWIQALTIGYTHELGAWQSGRLALGASLTGYVLPADFKPTYGDSPWAAKVFLQLQGMRQWD